MKYRLIKGSLNDINNPQLTILKNRGIKDIGKFLNIDKNVVYDYQLLKNIDKAVECLLGHVDNKSNIHIVVDWTQSLYL